MLACQRQLIVTSN